MPPRTRGGVTGRSSQFSLDAGCGAPKLRRLRSNTSSSGMAAGASWTWLESVRTVPMPTWIKVAIDAWATIAGIADGSVFRSVNRAGAIRDTALSEKVVWQLIRPYAEAAGVAGIAPHDCRRTCAKLCGAARGELEQIQMLLGHASVQTTERYLGTKQDLVNAPNDGIKLKLLTLRVTILHRFLL